MTGLVLVRPQQVPHFRLLHLMEMDSSKSPSSSPRFPSPPPYPEVQIDPQSPTIVDKSPLLNKADDAASRRIRPGTKAEDMASGPPLVPLSQLDSPFQLQEHLKALYQNYISPSDSPNIAPITQDVAIQLALPPEGVERSLWVYELCRFLTMKANNLIVAFFAENPPCSAQTCPEMRASEWQYLCAVHDPPKPCCAIDYCCHTLDWATNLLTSPKFFPSRLTLGSESGGGSQASMRHVSNIFRRVYRIFAHAWFQHRQVFWEVEGHDGLYIFFQTVCDIYKLVPEEGYTIPPEAAGVQPEQKPAQNGTRFSILRKQRNKGNVSEKEDPGLYNIAATTRRHKNSPSTGVSVGTIAEDSEESDLQKNRDLLEEEPVITLPSTNSPAHPPDSHMPPPKEGEETATPAYQSTNEPSSEPKVEPDSKPTPETDAEPELDTSTGNDPDDTTLEPESAAESELASESKVEHSREKDIEDSTAVTSGEERTLLPEPEGESEHHVEDGADQGRVEAEKGSTRVIETKGKAETEKEEPEPQKKTEEQEKTEKKLEEIPDEHPDENLEEKPEGRPEERPETKPDGKPEAEPKTEVEDEPEQESKPDAS